MDCEKIEDVEGSMKDATPVEVEDEEEYEGDLNDDLYDALNEDYDFTGSYYHRSVEPNAPNPGLAIEGVGLIGLPLSHRDAVTIISRAAQAPFGKGEETVIDTTVRDTWEIEPTIVSFLNPKWETFIDEISSKKVWTTLGVKPYTTKPRCELYKLLLYQTGSHFLPHQDTAKAKGMFATVIVVLPSLFEGGEVHVSHAGRSTVLDVSQGSFFNTSVLAWYTDVIHEVKPITSGYRLALSYNLIHTSTNTPVPSLPSAPHDALEILRETFRRWNADKYHISEELDLPLYAYMLSHQYSEADLKRGMDALKGKDAHLVSLILPVVEEMDFVLCLANLKKTEVGYPEDHGGRHKRGRWYDGSDEDEDETPEMAEIESKRLELSKLVCLRSTGVMDLGLRSFEISEEALVPPDAFDDMSPDDQEYEGYQGNGAGSLEQWYHRSALVLYRKVDQTSILMSISGPSAVLRTLPLTDTPTPAAQEVIFTVLAKLSDSESAITIANHAVLWKQCDIWNKAVPFIGPLEAISASTSEALKLFSLDLIRPGLTELIRRRPGVQARLAVIKTIATLLPDGSNPHWIQDLTKDTLSSYSVASVADVPALVQLAQEVEGGVTTLATVVIPKTTTQANTYDFHIALTEAFDRERKRLIDSQGDVKEIEALGGLTHQCLLAASLQWATPPPPPPSAAYYQIRHNPTLSPTVLAERVNHLIKLCLSFENPDLCVQIVKTVGVDRQMDVLNTIRSQNVDARSTWVKELMQTVVSTYSTPAVSHIPTLSWIAETIGAEHLEKLVATKVPKSGSYEFLLALAKSLHERLSRISTAQVTTEGTKASFHTALLTAIVSAIPQWEAGLHVTPQYYHGYGIVNAANHTGTDVKVKRILDLVEFSFTIGDLSPLHSLFTTLLQIEPNVDVSTRFKELHTPLIPLLKATLTKHGKTIVSEPFKSFFKGTISLYLGRVLGVVPPSSCPALPTRPIGCGCSDCKRLKDWLSSSVPTIDFRAPQVARTHLEKQIYQAKITNLVTYDTSRRGTPYTLVVSKRPEIMSGLRWKEAQTAALEFVQVVGDNDQNLRELMQDRYGDMIKSFSGTKSFVVRQSSISGSTASAASGPSGSNNAPTAVAGVAPIAGGKRKHRNPPTNVIDIIDLT